VKLPVVNRDSDPNRNVGRTDLSGEIGSFPASRESDPMPAMTRPGAGPAQWRRQLVGTWACAPPLAFERIFSLGHG